MGAIRSCGRYNKDRGCCLYSDQLRYTNRNRVSGKQRERLQMRHKLNVVSYTLAAMAGLTLVCGLAILAEEVRI